MPTEIDLHHDGRHYAMIPDGGQITTFELVAGNTARPLDATLKASSDEPLDLTDAYSITFKLWDQTHGYNHPMINRRAEIVDAESGHVRYEWRQRDVDRSGSWKAAFEIRYRDGETLTVPTDPFTVRIKRP